MKTPPARLQVLGPKNSKLLKPSVAFFVYNRFCATTMRISQDDLRAFWHTSAPGRLTPWQQSLALALRLVSQEMYDGHVHAERKIEPRFGRVNGSDLSFKTFFHTSIPCDSPSERSYGLGNWFCDGAPCSSELDRLEASQN